MQKQLFLCLIILLVNLIHCSKESSPPKKVDKDIGQELLFINQELENKNYTAVIDFINKYFEENELNEKTARILFIKGEILQKLAKELNKKLTRKNMKLAKKYGLTVKGKKFYYNFKEFRNIWEKFPDIQIGKDAFKIWYNSLKNIDDKISALEEYISRIKKDNAKIQIELANLYLTKLKENRKKYYKKLLKLYDKIIESSPDNREKAEAFINKNLLYFKQKRDIDKLKENFLKFKSKFPLYNSIKYYILGEINFSKGKLDEAYDYFEESLKFLKRRFKSDKVPLFLAILEEFPDNTIDIFKNEIIKKKELVKALLKYNKRLSRKRFFIITGRRVRVRKEPIISTKNIITSLNYGDKVIVIERSKSCEVIEGRRNYWYKVELKDGTTGWVFGQYLASFLINQK